MTDENKKTLIEYLLSAGCMAAEIVYENDGPRYELRGITPAERWQHMRRWVDKVLENPRMGEV